MTIKELKKLGREEIIRLAQEEIKKDCDAFDPANFERTKVLAKEGSIRVVFDMVYRFVPRDEDEFRLGYVAEAIFSDNSVSVRVPNDLFEPSAKSKEAAAALSDIKLTDEAIVTIYDNDDYYEATVSRGIDGGAEGYKISKSTGERKMIWHEHPDPGLETRIFGLADQDDFKELGK